MKLIITNPKLHNPDGRACAFPRGSFHQRLFEYYMMNEECYYGNITKFCWNNYYGFWDITAYEVKCRVRNFPDEILQQTKFWEDEGYKVIVQDTYYDYDSDKRYVCGVRYWITPKKE